MTTLGTVSAHMHRYEDEDGNLIDAEYFCSDWCHRDWCDDNSQEYNGWDGCHEVDGPQRCAHCKDGI